MAKYSLELTTWEVRMLKIIMFLVIALAALGISMIMIATPVEIQIDQQLIEQVCLEKQNMSE